MGQLEWVYSKTGFPHRANLRLRLIALVAALVASPLADPAHAAPADDEADSATQTDAGAVSAPAGDSRVYLGTSYGEREACETWGGEWDDLPILLRAGAARPDIIRGAVG